MSLITRGSTNLVYCLSIHMLLHENQPNVYEPGSLARARVRRTPAFLSVVLTTFVSLAQPPQSVNCFLLFSSVFFRFLPFSSKNFCRRSSLQEQTVPRPQMAAADLRILPHDFLRFRPGTVVAPHAADTCRLQLLNSVPDPLFTASF